ncbi:hypothetical protein RUND412_008226 [Rhizina undulata]
MTRTDLATNSSPVSKNTDAPWTTPKASCFKAYTPTRSSPLSGPQNAMNALGDPNMLPPSPPVSPPSFMTPQRLFKPTFPSREECRETRRNLFLKKVRDGRDEKLAKSRGGDEEMMRMIFVSEKKRWEAAQARAAARIPTIYENVELESGTGQECGEILEEGPLSYDHEDHAHFQEILEEFDREEGMVPACVESQSEDMEEIMEREGRELEALLSQLDLDQVMGNGVSPVKLSENNLNFVESCQACGSHGISIHEGSASCMNCGFYSH